MDFRRAGHDLWHRRDYDAASELTAAATDTFYDVRTAAFRAYYKFRLVTTDPELAAMATRVIEAASALPELSRHDELRQGRSQVSSLIDNSPPRPATGCAPVRTHPERHPRGGARPARSAPAGLLALQAGPAFAAAVTAAPSGAGHPAWPGVCGAASSSGVAG